MRVVVTGANRGIGLEFVRQLSARGDELIAAARHPKDSPELVQLEKDHGGRVKLAALDVTSDDSVQRFTRELGGQPIDVLINNAGVYGDRESLEDLDLGEMAKTYDVNAIGPLRLTRALLPLIEAGNTKKLLHVTSKMGSITDNTSGGSYGYRMSKAALNMMSRTLAVDLRAEGIISIVVNPGWVKTDMGGEGAPTPAADSVKGMIQILDRVTLRDSGEFFDYRGPTVPY